MRAPSIAGRFGLASILTAMVAGEMLAPPSGSAAELHGEAKLWHRVELWFQGPAHARDDTSPHPFLDYRLQCAFTAPSGAVFDVPGFFDTNGTGGAAGDVWKCRFSPDEPGQWRWVASFRAGAAVAVSLAAGAGDGVWFDGERGTVTVGDSDKSPPDFRAPKNGFIEYTRSHYFRSAGSGRPWIKTGANIPENFLGYAGFDATPAAGHTFAAHVRDWREGDPTWDGDAGKGIIGALNFLAARGANAIYFLPMNVGGDANDTYPTLSPTDKTHYHTRKLLEWEEVFEHCDRLGILLHFQLAETESENENYHDDGELGRERKLFYRELVARFGHHLGVEWDIGEENDYTTEQRKAFAQHIAALDPYDHPITTHNRPALLEDMYAPLLGVPAFSATAFQGGSSVLDLIAQWRKRSAAAGRPWVISFDEPQGIEAGSLAVGRTNRLWPALLAGAGGFEWYVQEDGGGHDFDQRIDDFRAIEPLLVWGANARRFLAQLPLDEMEARDDLSNADATLAAPGRVYALYARASRELTVDLSRSSGAFDVAWFSPVSGAWRTAPAVEAGGVRTLGEPPFEGDVAVLVSRAEPAACGSDAACDDRNPCNGREACNEGTCTPGSPPPCKDGNPCTADYCDAAKGCVSEALEDGAACNDGSFCNGVETCSGGTCTAGDAPCAGDGNPCTVATCDERRGCAHEPLPDGTTCNDRISCTGPDRCAAGACAGADTCTAGETCDAAADACRAERTPGDLVCIAAGAPAAVAGSMTAGAEYADGDDADGAADSLTDTLLFADSSENAMQGGSGDEARYAITLPARGPWWLWGRFYYPGRPGSNDANSFRVALDSEPSVKFGNNKERFRVWHWDGDGEVEYGAPVPIALGTLEAGAHAVVVEKREVWPGGGVQPRLDALCFTRRALPPADDEVAALLAGKRTCSSAAHCDDGDACTRDACDASNATCTHTARRCDDDNPCTVDACEEAIGCAAIAEADGAPCDDGLECTAADACSHGVCIGVDACPGAQSCNKTTGMCEPPPIAVDQHTGETACSIESDRLTAPIVLEDAASKLLVVLVACATDDNPAACNLSEPYTAEFGGMRLHFAGQATSASTPVVTSGVYYLAANEVDAACADTYPCVGRLELELRSGASTIDVLAMGAVLLRNALQEGPAAFAASGAPRCSETVVTAVPAPAGRALALAIAAARGAAFDATSRPLRTEMSGACGRIVTQITSRALRETSSAEMTAALPAPATCSHAAAVFDTAPAD